VEELLDGVVLGGQRLPLRADAHLQLADRLLQQRLLPHQLLARA